MSLARRGVALVLLAVTTVACTGDDDDPAAPVVIADVPDAYRIEYRIDDGDRESSERLTVRRPFESRLETFDESDDASGEPTVVEISSFGRSARSTDATQRIAVAVPPAPPPADVRLDTVLDRAIDAGLLEPRGTKEILDRPCRVYRTGQTLRLIELTPPTDDGHVDACVDSAGLVLEEIERVDGEETRHRIAIDVDVDAAFDDELFDPGERSVPIDRGGGSVRELTASSRTPGEFLELGDDLPLPHRGRYAVVPPQPDAFTDPSLTGRRVASLSDVLHDDRDVVVVARGGSLEGAVEVPVPDHAEPIDVGGLGRGHLQLTAQGPVVVVELDGNRFVRVSGTLATDDVAAVGRGLHPVDGGELTPTGDQW